MSDIAERPPMPAPVKEQPKPAALPTDTGSLDSVLTRLKTAAEDNSPKASENNQQKAPVIITQIAPETKEQTPPLPHPKYNKKYKSWQQEDAKGNIILSTIDRRLRAADKDNDYHRFNEIPFKMQQEHALEILELKGFLRKGPNGEIICNLDRFKGDNNYRDDLWTLLGPIARNDQYKYRPLGEVLVDIFGDLNVYSDEDYKRLEKGEQISPKKLFYIPENEQSAFDINKIKNSNSYMGLWNIGTGKSRGKVLGKYRYPTVQEGWNNKLPEHETVIAALVYHPSYGKGYRNENGDLIVTFRDGSEKKISFQFFEDWGYGGRSNKQKITLYSSPSRYILDYCPTLRSKGLVKPEDFKIVHSDELLQIRKPTHKGLVRFDWIGYNLGTEFAKEGIKVFKLNNYSAVIIDFSKGDEQIIGLFKLQSPTKEELQTNKLIKGNRFTYGVNDIEFIYKAKENTPEQFIRYLVTLPRKQQELLMSAAINFNDYADIVNTFMKIQADPSITKAVRDSVEFWGKKLRGLDNDLLFHNIQTFYGIFEKGKVDMTEVAKVSMNRAKQIAMIKKYLPNTPNALVVDAACGLGELLFAVANDEEVKSKNLQFFGYDLADDYVQEARAFAKQNGFHNVDIVKGNWTASPVEPGEASLISCVGRSGHHMNGFTEAHAFFADKNRALAPDGILIFDALDPTTGEYRQNRLKLVQILKGLGKNFSRFGAKAEREDYIDEFPYTVDAPWGNDKDFFNRFTPSIQKWQEIAAEHGFELVEFIREPIFPHDVTREDHENTSPNELNCTFVFRKKAEVPPASAHSPSEPQSTPAQTSLS